MAATAIRFTVATIGLAIGPCNGLPPSDQLLTGTGVAPLVFLPPTTGVVRPFSLPAANTGTSIPTGVNTLNTNNAAFVNTTAATPVIVTGNAFGTSSSVTPFNSMATLVFNSNTAPALTQSGTTPVLIVTSTPAFVTSVSPITSVSGLTSTTTATLPPAVVFTPIVTTP